MKKFFSLVMAVCASAMLFAGDLYKADFTKDQQSWTIENKTLPEGLTYVWKWDSYKNEGYMKASAFVSGTAIAAESWIVSPAIDLTAAKAATLKLNQAVNKGAATNLKVKISADNGTTWNDIAIGMPAGTSWNFQDDEAAINDYAGKTIKLAFAYVSTTSICPTWEVKTVTIYENGDTPEEPDVVKDITIADAIALCEKMETGSYSKETYRVVGVVTLAYDYNSQYTNQTFYFGASEDAEKGATIEAYRAKSVAPGVAKGDKIVVTGNLGVRKTSNGDRSYGFAQGCTVEKVPSTAVEDVQVNATKAVKVIENGQLVIIRDGVRYNAVGAVVE